MKLLKNIKYFRTIIKLNKRNYNNNNYNYNNTSNILKQIQTTDNNSNNNSNNSNNYNKDNNNTIIVIDDDPTGCQTVYNINLLLNYSIQTIQKQLQLNHKLFYILSNTRAMNEKDSINVTSEILKNIEIAKKNINYPNKIEFISRGDSTLRGHYPAEVNTIMSYLKRINGDKFNGCATVLLPAFFEGGRVTIDSVHYLTEKDQLIPVGLTPFAADPHFGYKSSNLKDWVIEKSKGNIQESDIHTLTIQEMHKGGSDAVFNKLLSILPNQVLIVDTVDQNDLNIFVSGLLKRNSQVNSDPNLMKNLPEFVFRTAASFVATRCGLAPRPLLTKFDLESTTNTNETKKSGGLIVVGSYVPKTTAQLENLLNNMDIESILFDVEHFSSLLSYVNSKDEITKYVNDLSFKINSYIEEGKHVVIYTSRKVSSSSTTSTTQDISFHKLVSDSLTSIVKHLKIQPSFLIAKGGITSHDVASIGLGVEVAEVIGQIDVGVPVWKTQSESKFPGMSYVVYPGNVGDNNGLCNVAEKLGVKRKLINSIESKNLNKVETDEQIKLIRSTNRTFQLLQNEKNKSFAVAAFNIYNLEGAKAVVDAAEELQSPIILQVHPSSLNFGGPHLLNLLASYRSYASVPISIHLDHTTSDNDLCYALDMNINGKTLLDSVMIDGSEYPLEKNISWTSKMASLAHERGIVVEAELGRLVGEEDGLSVPEIEGKMTDPLVVKEFLLKTKVDMLAVTIGNVHGKYAKPPSLDFQRLSQIRQIIESSTNSNIRETHLVLHGASGLPTNQINQSINDGKICKFNVNTDLRNASLSNMKKQFESKGNKVDILKLMNGSYEAMKIVAKEKILLFKQQSESNSK